jgi:hypothetical protein
VLRFQEASFACLFALVVSSHLALRCEILSLPFGFESTPFTPHQRNQQLRL